MCCHQVFQRKQLHNILFSPFFWGRGGKCLHPKCFNSSLGVYLKACLVSFSNEGFYNSIQFSGLSKTKISTAWSHNKSWLHTDQNTWQKNCISSSRKEVWTHLHCSLELCLRRGERTPWALPSCKFSFLFVLEGGWLNVCARLRNCGESESSSGNICHAEDSGEAGGVPGGESPGE